MHVQEQLRVCVCVGRDANTCASPRPSAAARVSLTSLVHAILLRQPGPQRIEHLLGVSQQHGSVGPVEERVVHRRVADAQRPLDDHRLVRLVAAQDGHAPQRRVGVLHRAQVDRVVGAGHDHKVGVGEVVIDLLHLQHDVIRNLGLRQQHVQLARHASSHRVHTNAHLLALASEHADHIRQRVLGLGDRQPITRHDNHAVGVLQGIHRLVHVPQGHLALDLLGRASCVVRPAAEKHIGQRAVHRTAHDVGENGARRTDQRAHGRQRRAVQHEALSAQSPTGV
mmetsp:Transcript_19190/g.61045  ORF Transcript_19190/g.61045 Transcript_19190/m.61045 type:complete len:282 (+) Transcript_19190:362-1207(+)